MGIDKYADNFRAKAYIGTLGQNIHIFHSNSKKQVRHPNKQCLGCATTELMVPHSVLLLLLLLLVTPPVLLLHTKVDRSSDGDTFEASCNTCRSHNARCDDTLGRIFMGCCDKCQCAPKYTYYESTCRKNIPQEQLRCELFLEKDEYYGLVTRHLGSRTTHLGFVKYKWYWNRQVRENNVSSSHHLDCYYFIISYVGS